MSITYENDNQNEEDDGPILNAWEDLEVSTDLLRGIYAYGYEKPSPIQRKAIQPILKKKT